MPAINDRGQVAFVADMAGGPSDFGVFRGDGRSLTAVFLSNQGSPGGATFLDFGDPAINNRGQLAASALLSGADPHGLFVGDGEHIVAIALEGQPVPRGGNYRGIFSDPITLNDRGDVAFSIGLTGSTGGHGLFRGDGSHTTAIALAGTLASGTTGMFSTFGDMRLGEDGRVAFIATLTPGIGGVDTTNSRGIWVGTSDRDLQLVVRTGDVVGGKVLTNLPSGLGQLDMNGTELAWIGTAPLGRRPLCSHASTPITTRCTIADPAASSGNLQHLPVRGCDDVQIEMATRPRRSPVESLDAPTTSAPFDWARAVLRRRRRIRRGRRSEVLV